MPPTPLTDEEVARTLGAVEDAMRYRLRMIDVIPLEMSNYHIGKVLLSTLRALALILLIEDGRVFFIAPRLFRTSLCVCGARKDDGWFFLDVEFLFNIGGDATSLQGRLLL